MMVVFTLLGAGFGTVLYQLSYPDAAGLSGLLQARFLSILPASFLAGFLGAWIWAWGYLRRRQIPGFFHSLVLLVLSTAALSFGTFLMAGITQNARENPIALGHGIGAGQLHSTGSTLLRVHNAGPLLLEQVYLRTSAPESESIVQSTVLFDETRQELLLQTGQRMGVDQTEAALEELAGLRSTIPVASVRTSLRADLDIGQIPRFVLSGMQGIGEILMLYGSELSVRLFVLAASISLFCAGAGLFQRGRVWAVLAPIMGMAVSAGGIVLLWFLSGAEVQDLASEFLQSRSLGYLGPGVLAALGLIFAVLSGLWPAVRRPRERSGDEE